MLKFRVDNSEARRASNDKTATQVSTKPTLYEEAIPYEGTESAKTVAEAFSSEVPDSPDSTSAVSPSKSESTSSTDAVSPLVAESTSSTDAASPSVAESASSTDAASPSVAESTSSTDAASPSVAESTSFTDAASPSAPEFTNSINTDSSQVAESTEGTRVPKSKLVTFSSGEQELHEAIHGWISSVNNNTLCRRQWSIPESDSGDEFIKRENSWSVSDGTEADNKPSRPVISNFNLPSDSEEEDPYSMVKSPSMSVKSVEPPPPPPVSTIPRNKAVRQATIDVTEKPKSPSEIAAVETRAKFTVNAMVDLKKRSIISDTDPYDEIDCYSEAKQRQTKEVVGQSEPRFHFTLSKSRTRLNPTVTSTDDTYAEIPKKVPWNFPSSSDEEEEHETTISRKKVISSRSKPDRQESATSDEEDKPSLPPKMWEAANGNGHDLRNAEHSNKEDDITIEYSALQRINIPEDETLSYPKTSPTFTHSSGFEDNDDNGDGLSEHSEGSSKVVTDYEESCACIDMDQISLDSSGRRPKRIVETHETHEIVPADNNEDDIVERIIETQTITEKLDDKHNLPDYGTEDFPKYLEDDDEFVSHIFTLGRTLEKGSKKKRSKDFAFVENPFSVPDPVIETMPLEKKTVKQKITTLVKKKKAKDDENVYAEIRMTGGDMDSAEQGSENDDYDHMNDMVGREARRWSEATEQYEYNDPPARDIMKWDTSDRPKATEHSKSDYMPAGATSKGLSYEPINENSDFSQHEISDTQKETKTEKKSIFKGIKKLLKKKDKNQDACKVDPSVLDDDYQEFVP